MENICILDIYLDDISDQKEYIINYIFNKFRKKIPFNFNKINLTVLKLDIPNITFILPFQNFPVNNLNNLNLKNLTINDLKNITDSLLKHKPIFKRLSIFDISIGLILEDCKKYLKVLLTEKISEKLMSYFLRIPFYISFDDIIDIFSWIKKGENKNAAYVLKLSNEDLSKNVGNYSFVTSFENFLTKIKNKLHRKNLLTYIKYTSFSNINIGIKMLNKDKINYFLKIIFCFNKIYKKRNNKNVSKENGQKIFENIFYYIGNFNKKNKEIIVEII